jgi:undecaprenyl-diphosphatase
VAWVLVTAARVERREVLRALGVSLLVAEVVAQVLKHLVDAPRPLAVLPGLDPHGYPNVPHGAAYPSAHTALVVGAVCALWPWIGRSQRTVGVVLAVLVACNRVYIGAHWPLDVVGGAAIGALAGAVAWLVAERWPAAPASARTPADPA